MTSETVIALLMITLGTVVVIWLDGDDEILRSHRTQCSWCGNEPNDHRSGEPRVMQLLILTHPDGTFDVMVDRWNPNSDVCEVVETPDLKEPALSEEVARMAVPEELRDVYDFGHLVGFGRFSLLTESKAAMQSERRWTAKVIGAMEAAIEPLKTTTEEKPRRPGVRTLLVDGD